MISAKESRKATDRVLKALVGLGYADALEVLCGAVYLLSRKSGIPMFKIADSMLHAEGVVREQLEEMETKGDRT